MSIEHDRLTNPVSVASEVRLDLALRPTHLDEADPVDGQRGDGDRDPLARGRRHLRLVHARRHADPGAAGLRADAVQHRAGIRPVRRGIPSHGSSRPIRVGRW